MSGTHYGDGNSSVCVAHITRHHSSDTSQLPATGPSSIPLTPQKIVNGGESHVGQEIVSWLTFISPSPTLQGHCKPFKCFLPGDPEVGQGAYLPNVNEIEERFFWLFRWFFHNISKGSGCICRRGAPERWQVYSVVGDPGGHGIQLAQLKLKGRSYPAAPV